MAPKKIAKKKKKRPAKSRRRISLKRELIKIIIGMIALVFLVISAGLLTQRYLIRKQPIGLNRSAPSAPMKTGSVRKRPAHKKPVFKKPDPLIPRFEIYPEAGIPHHKPVDGTTASQPSQQLPQVAIIIDDLGYDRQIADKFLMIETALTFAVLPQSPFHKAIALKAKDKGFDVMLHIPMEPVEFPTVNPGPGALLVEMSPDQLIRQLNEHLDAIPFIKGANNHMGSKMTAESDRMNQIFSVLKKRGLFFVDSRTTAKTLSRQSARLFNVPFAQRDIFLDNLQDPDHIRKQLEMLIRYARRHGKAIGIGHPYMATQEVLMKQIPHLKKTVEFVPVSRIVTIGG